MNTGTKRCEPHMPMPCCLGSSYLWGGVFRMSEVPLYGYRPLARDSSPWRAYLPTRWTTEVSLVRIPGCYVTKFAPHTTLKSIARGNLTTDERVVVNRVVHLSSATHENPPGGGPTVPKKQYRPPRRGAEAWRYPCNRTLRCKRPARGVTIYFFNSLAYRDTSLM